MRQRITKSFAAFIFTCLIIVICGSLQMQQYRQYNYFKCPLMDMESLTNGERPVFVGNCCMPYTEWIIINIRKESGGL